MTLALPQDFPYYAIDYSTVNVFPDGYVTLGGYVGADPNNTTLPNPFFPNNALYAFWDDLSPDYVICSDASSPDCGTNGWIYTYQQGDWYALEYFQYDSFTNGAWRVNTFEILFNVVTGEIRYQYKTVPDGAASATIGLEDNAGSNAIQVSYNDTNGASDGTGYKFTPAPPQPSKTYTVTVDSTMQSVGFLLTGYSGSFEPLAVSDPDGNLISCSDTGVLCLDLDLVQYVQVNTDGRTGDWHATVDAGPTGSGTYSFISFAASPIAVKSGYDHTITTIGKSLLLDLSQAVDGNLLTGSFPPDGWSRLSAGISRSTMTALTAMVIPATACSAPTHTHRPAPAAPTCGWRAPRRGSPSCAAIRCPIRSRLWRSPRWATAITSAISPRWHSSSTTRTAPITATGSRMTPLMDGGSISDSCPSSAPTPEAMRSGTSMSI